MRRRDLFKRIAAVATVTALAPAVEAQAAPEKKKLGWVGLGVDPPTNLGSLEGVGMAADTDKFRWMAGRVEQPILDQAPATLCNYRTHGSAVGCFTCGYPDPVATLRAESRTAERLPLVRAEDLLAHQLMDPIPEGDVIRTTKTLMVVTLSDGTRAWQVVDPT